MGEKNERIWGVLLHLGTNMWSDVRVENRVTEGFYKWGGEDGWGLYSDAIRFDEALWREATGRMAAKGLNTVMIDLGEALAYPSHPELAVKGTWSVAKMKEELKRLRGMGLTPVPKLNFSTGHDPWLKEYERMVSTPDYYRVCADLIRDVVEIFDGPELFHLGYDEEDYWHQHTYGYVVVRQAELWWHDFEFFRTTVEKNGSRPWIWSDYVWRHRDEFLKRMSKSVLHSNWYYASTDESTFPKEKSEHDFRRTMMRANEVLEQGGFDQVPAGMVNDHFAGFFEYSRKVIPPERFKGMMNTVWCFTQPHRRETIFKAIDQIAEAKAKFGA
ncbi:MAG: Tat pathway signal protein [Kiritimatiellae bacterium]|nr:Tat pathway signal protein [Kiritimatiellia bacterium]